MSARRLTATAAVIGTLALAACSNDAGTTTAATPASGITSAASSAATADTADPEGFPTAPADLPTRAKDGTIYPGETWEQVRPRALGFNAQRIKAIARDARPSKTTCLLVARKGRIVGEWNWLGMSPETPREVFSVTKSVTSTLVGTAQADGDLEIDQPARRYVPEWRGTASRRVTIRNLLTNDSGRHWDLGTDYSGLVQAKDRTQYAVDLKQQYPPGQVWAYNNAAVQTLDGVISEATGQPTREYAASRLFGPIGMTHTQMTADPAGNTNTFFGVQTTCEDLARFGYLFLRQGRWGDDQVVPWSWVRAAVGRPSQEQRGVRLPVVAQPLWPDHRPARHRRARPARATGRPDDAGGRGQRLHRAGPRRPDRPRRPRLRDGRRQDRSVHSGQRRRLHGPRRRPVRHRGLGPPLSQTATSSR